MNGKLLCAVTTLLILLAGIIGRGEAKDLDVQIAPPKVQKKILGVFIFPGFELLDAYGPMEMWGNLRHAPDTLWDKKERSDVQVVTIAAKPGPVASAQGPKTVADYGFADAPRLDFLLVPGGMAVFSQMKDRATLDWLRTQAQQTPLVMSVCNGASFLAAAGILDNRPATTNKMFWKMSTDPGPKVKWVKKARWVDDGTVVTASGVSAGMDMSLAVIGRLYGQGVAEWLAQVTEYDAHRDSLWDPFAKKAGLVE